MPYLPIDIDGRRNCAKAAAVLHASPGDVSWALQEMWEHVWREWFAGRRESADVLSDLILMGCLGPLSENSKAPDVLVGFGFLERVPTGYRIRGAAKWLFGLEGKSRGGKAAAGNLIPGGPKRTKSAESQPSPMSQGAGECRDLSREGAETPAETQPVGRPSALTPSTQHPAPKESTPLGERMCAAFREEKGADYEPSFTDQQALRELLRLAKGNEEEIVRRYRVGLRRPNFPRITTWVDLSKHWNACTSTADPPPSPIPKRDPNRPIGVVKNEF